MNIDFSIASSSQIKTALCAQVGKIRLSKNLTQAQLAKEAGIALLTLQKFEKGQGVSLDTFIRVLTALDLQGNLAALLPDPSVRPVERVSNRGRERQRARPLRTAEEKGSWSWGDEKGKQK
jgi:transcriptional regulator with XRE-family HTH domain